MYLSATVEMVLIYSESKELHRWCLPYWNASDVLIANRELQKISPNL